MNLIARHFGGGEALFTCAAILIIATLPGFFALTRKLRMAAVPATLVGVAVVVFAAAALPLWFYALWGLLIAGWLALEGPGIWRRRPRPGVDSRADRPARHAVVLRVLLLLCCCAAILLELPYHVVPSVPAGNYEVIYVVGDSISAGVGQGEKPWPRVLADRHGVEVVNVSSAGATVADALGAVGRVRERDAVVILEIGGNDYFGRLPIARFEENLDRLIRAVSGPGRAVLLFELPLPPTAVRYGMVQRRLARRHGVRLIPRRTFARIVTREEMTLGDRLHFSQQGHDAMAEAVWEILDSRDWKKER